MRESSLSTHRALGLIPRSIHTHKEVSGDCMKISSQMLRVKYVFDESLCRWYSVKCAADVTAIIAVISWGSRLTWGLERKIQILIWRPEG